jgi:hypothetical protein
MACCSYDPSAILDMRTEIASIPTSTPVVVALAPQTRKKAVVASRRTTPPRPSKKRRGRSVYVCIRCRKRPIAVGRSKSRCARCLKFAKSYALANKPKPAVRKCEQCKTRRVFGRRKRCDKCKKNARLARHPHVAWAPHKPCARPGCPNLARVKYCDDACRKLHYNEKRSRRETCGICGRSGHSREQCDSPAAVELPSLRSLPQPRACSSCGDTDHDRRHCHKRCGPDARPAA